MATKYYVYNKVRKLPLSFMEAIENPNYFLKSFYKLPIIKIDNNKIEEGSFVRVLGIKISKITGVKAIDNETTFVEEFKLFSGNHTHTIFNFETHVDYSEVMEVKSKVIFLIIKFLNKFRFRGSQNRASMVWEQK